MIKEKMLIIHADDIGMSYASNKAAIDLFIKGTVTSGSIIVPGNWARDFILWWKNNKKYDIGIHSTFTCEWEAARWKPLSNVAQCPNLYDAEGFMPRTTEEVSVKATSTEIELELRYQIEQALSLGLRPSHLDRHMWVASSNPQFFKKYVSIAKEYGIIYQMGIPKLEYEVINILSEKYPVRKLDAIIGCVEGVSYEEKKKHLIRTISEIEYGVTQFTIHPVFETTEIKEIIPNWKERYFEYRLFMEDDIMDAISAQGIKLISYKDLVNLQKRNL